MRTPGSITQHPPLHGFCAAMRPLPGICMLRAMKQITRRGLITQSAAFSGAAVLGLPLIAQAAQGDAPAKLKVVDVGGHPDDPESGVGGTMARLADLGHEVVALYLTRGEAGIKGKSADDAAAIRSAECEAACRILNARPA